MNNLNLSDRAIEVDINDVYKRIIEKNRIDLARLNKIRSKYSNKPDHLIYLKLTS